jgi:uncharacterized membrane protein
VRTTEARGPRALQAASLILAVAGLAVSAYLTYERFTSSTTLACPNTGTVNCTKVTTSSYSTLLGVPVAMLGLLFFVVMTTLSLPAPALATRTVRRLRLAMAVVGVLFVIYLVWAELFRINAICLWCTGVHALTIALFAVVVFQAANDDRVQS